MFGIKTRLENIESAVRENNAIIEYVKFKVFENDLLNKGGDLEEKMNELNEKFSTLTMAICEFKKELQSMKGVEPVKVRRKYLRRKKDSKE